MYKPLVLLFLIMFLIPVVSNAVTIKLSDGTEIDLEGLTDTEKSNMIKYVEKMNKKAAESVGSTATEIIMESAKDPVKLNEWRKLITGTIKDVADDLSMTVNEFVKTPVGAGVAGLIFYKVAGKDMFSKFFSVVLAIPFWIVVMIVIGFTTRAFLGHKTEYIEVRSTPNHLTDSDVKKAVKEQVDASKAVDLKIPIRVCRYKWTSNDARNIFGVFMIVIPLAMTLVCCIIVFA